MNKPNSKIYRAALRTRTAMLAADRATIRRMAQYYGVTWSKISREIESLVVTTDISIARWNTLRSQIATEIAKLCELMADETEIRQALMAKMGARQAEALLAASKGVLPAAIKNAGLDYTWNRIPESALRNMAGILADGSPLKYKFEEMATDISDGIKDEIMSGLAKGVNPRQIANTIKKKYDDGMKNVLCTVRTEILRSYRLAAHATYRSNSDKLNGWVWMAAQNARTCPICWGLHGTVHSLDEVMTDHPSGRCTAVPMTKTWAELFPNIDLGDYKESSIGGFDAEERFKSLPAKTQARILGPKKYDAWRTGDIALRDIPKPKSDPVWGDGYRAKTLDELGIADEKA